IEATATDRAPFRQSVSVAPGGTIEVPVVFPEAPPPPPSAGVRRGLSPGPFVVMGVGVAALGASLGLYLARNGALANCMVQTDAMGDFLLCDTPDDGPRVDT